MEPLSLKGDKKEVPGDGYWAQRAAERRESILAPDNVSGRPLTEAEASARRIAAIVTRSSKHEAQGRMSEERQEVEKEE